MLLTLLRDPHVIIQQRGDDSSRARARPLFLYA